MEIACFALFIMLSLLHRDVFAWQGRHRFPLVVTASYVRVRVPIMTKSGGMRRPIAGSNPAMRKGSDNQSPIASRVIFAGDEQHKNAQHDTYGTASLYRDGAAADSAHSGRRSPDQVRIAVSRAVGGQNPSAWHHLESRLDEFERILSVRSASDKQLDRLPNRSISLNRLAGAGGP
jgi:hypothetical protein